MLILFLMICGLFSSFDPSLFESMIPVTKWSMIVACGFFLYPSSFVAIISMNSFLKKSIIFFWESVNQLSSSSKKMFIILFSIFFFILISNFLGLTPFFFTSTSHLSVNLSLSLPLWLGGLIFSFYSSVSGSLAHIVPLGSPLPLWPLLVIVETVSLLIRPFSLSVRLMANVMAGHLILSLMSDSVSLSSSMTPMISIVSGFLLFEVGVSLIQAYVFTNLMTLYWEEGNH
nr:ATP synthase F0 subunit 6 [Pessoaiella absita]